tara:strand:- start:739 stop:975 length:237 start_codon:yes stop_codon:yes gene_type:complete
MLRLRSLITLPFRMFFGCMYTIKEYILLELQNQKIIKIEEDDALDELDTYIWLQAFDDQKILSTTVNYLENCYAKSES